jgi:hypothetical protein
MTQYMLSVHDEGPDAVAATMTPDDMQEIFEAVDAFNAEVQAAGAWVFAGGLTAPTSATTVRAHQGELLITDGPFTETKEHLGGFWIIEAPDLDAALAWAEKGSIACRGAVEVRPFQDEPPA